MIPATARFRSDYFLDFIDSQKNFKSWGLVLNVSKVGL